MKVLRYFIFSALLLTTFPASAADDLAAGFRNPPAETKPYCYWYWLTGDITKEGITKDLEAMARAGILQAMIGNIEGGGPVKMFSPEWYALTRHALKEASRVGVDIMMFNVPGWSQSGGPWIKPEQSMRRIIWNEVQAGGGKFSRKVRPDLQPLVQDVAVLAVPRRKSVSLRGTVSPAKTSELSLSAAKWIWHPSENGAENAVAATKYFRRVIEADPLALGKAELMLTADNTYALWVNGKKLHQGSDWQRPGTVSIRDALKKGANVIAVAVNNTEASPAGLIASMLLVARNGQSRVWNTDSEWLAGESEADGWREAVAPPTGWQAARVLGPVSMGPWGLDGAIPRVIRFRHSEPFKARALAVRGDIDPSLYAVKDGKRELVVEVRSAGSNGDTDFLPDGPRVFSFKEVTAQEFGRFAVSATLFDPPKGSVEVKPPGVISTAEYHAPDLPSPQDWVLVMERLKP